MRLILTLNSKKEIILPLYYNEILQGFIYKNIEKSIAEEIHNRGFLFEKRNFKLFTFSRLIGKTKIEKSFFKIFTPSKLIISSPYNEMLQSLAENLIKWHELKLGDNTLYIESISIHYTPEIKETVFIRMLSPITIYSTLNTPDGRKKTYYYNPKEKEFSELIRENIIKKYIAFYRKTPLSKEFTIEPLKVTREDEKIVSYKGFIIKGWMGKYRLNGSKELLQLAYDGGIGAKNSQGFGCFEVEG
ncbi:CRISPR-associated endoribonuclease Cas6 [Thermodesulfovibrio yellowstonii]|uniref:CRISPR-associated endoribonuclease n=1 Tax=Thermodesulfovibrio yellowstonii TaxID=28262 RepID=A0A9W6GGU9_9BACT|nr:CRISPR-associated endoribonuclease Cas6 [Thermodesulfovibrio islandicus]GLI53636.1 CRISPR-associated endoribonuclease [Thermodesulfovibrio islandicus]